MQTRSYTPAHDAEVLVMVNGVVSTDGLSLNGKVVTVSASSLDKKTVTISDGYKLAIGNDVEQPTKCGKKWKQVDEDNYIYTNNGMTAG